MREVEVVRAHGPATVETVNSRHWVGAKHGRRRSRQRLRAAETGLLERYRDQLRGNVLELDSATGRLTDRLAHDAAALTGLTGHAGVAARARRRHPAASFIARDLRDLGDFADGEFSAVVAGRHALDLLGDRERRRLLDHLHRVLGGDGVLIFSSHNLGCESLVRDPARNLSANPFRALNRLLRMPASLRNRAHLRLLQEREHGYAVLNDDSRDYAVLHYYVSRDGQERQLAEHCFRLLECVALDDSPVGPGELAYGCRELYYAAQPVNPRV